MIPEEGEVGMPVFDAKALKTDRKGLAFLRAVLSKETPGTGARETGQRSVLRPEAPAETDLTVRRRSAGIRA
jgi:hypothetical protein